MEIKTQQAKKSLFSDSAIEQLKEESESFQILKNEISKAIVGNKEIIDFIIIAVLCDGHILLEGVPGVAKTTIIKTVTKALGLSFQRIQFTPDLLPADLIGTLIYNPKTQDFETKKGPVFSNLVLADEINRSPAKVQAALLEAMQEQQVTIGSTTYQLDRPFLVFATQNPIEQEGTYKLPEAQVDRFMFKLIVNYLSIDEEKEIVGKNIEQQNIEQVFTKKEILSAQKRIKEVYVDERIIKYLIDIVFATREPQNFGLNDLSKLIMYGVSPRATLALYKAAQARAFIKRRYFVTPDDIKAVAPVVMRHRILLSYEAEAEGITSDMIIQKILETIPSP
ncbi:MoxR family ATPase [bacterium]|jgi:MoxR-like ATPase|nr:MoxR family ATPase [bacterium]